MKVDKSKYFYCYDAKCSRHLKSNGFDYITLAKNRNDDRLFSLYEMTSELKEVLSNYKK